MESNETATPHEDDKQGLFSLRGVVQNYDWGGYTFIPSLLGLENPEHKPFAELWIGANSNYPSLATVEGQEIPLNELIAKDSSAMLGEETASRYQNRLPYLFKALDACKMLSIQAHPTKQQAEEGFARENAMGIDLKASNRNYKDDNHKPEVHIALTDFWMLHGFRPLEEIAYTLQSVPELAPLMPDFTVHLTEAGQDRVRRKALLRALYEKVMTHPQAEADALLNPLLARLEKEKPEDKNQPDFWALRAAHDFPLPDGHRDRGIFSIYLLNLVSLKPGEGTYQSAGTLHAYLEGVNIELMANSDNVLRGGLTPKHVDVQELLNTLTFESGKPEVLQGEAVSKHETVYRTPAAEFELSCIELGTGDTYSSQEVHGPDCLLITDGDLQATTENTVHEGTRGTILYAPANQGYKLRALYPATRLFRATVPHSR